MKIVHCKKEAHDVYIGRPSIWGNPFTHDKKNVRRGMILVESREKAIELYEIYVRDKVERKELLDLKEIAGKTLGCWCAPKSCHGDVLVKLCREQGLLDAEEGR
jgi:hypothetical protein